MRKMMIIAIGVSLVITTAVNAVELRATNGYYFAGTSAIWTTPRSPQFIAARAELMSSDDKDDIRYNGDSNVFTHNQTDPTIYYAFIMLTFTKPGSYDDADFYWRSWVDGGANIYVRYWDDDSWETLDSNSGGSNPSQEIVDVDDEMDEVTGNTFNVLIYGEISASNEDWQKMDIGKINYTVTSKN